MPRIRRSTPWVGGILAIYGLGAAAILLTPVSFASVVHAIGRAVRAVPGLGFFGSGWIEFVANIALFVPLGFLLSLVVRRPWVGALLGLLLSVSVELVQLVIPDRQATIRDVLSNAIGAAIGALLAWAIVLRRRRGNAEEGPVAGGRRSRS